MRKADVSPSAPSHAVVDEIRLSALRDPHGLAVCARGAEAWSFRELLERVESVRAAMRAHGVTSGHRVALVMHDTPAFACALAAVSSVSACLPLSATTRADELERLLESARIDAIMFDAESASRFAGPVAARRRTVFEWSGTSAVRHHGPALAAPRAAPLAAGLLMPTSGTSGESKLVPIPGSACVAGARNIARALQLDGDDCCLNLTPLHHVSGQFMATFASWSAGASVIIVRDPARADVLASHMSFTPTWLCAVPPTLRRLSEGEASHARALHLRFIHTGAAALTPDTQAAIECAFEAPVVQSYGMTETLMISCNPRTSRRPGTVGQPQIPTRILDSAGRAVPAGHDGEICVRGPSVFSGYVEDLGSSRTRFVDGWFRTGDLGHLDSSGFLTITGRAKEVINRGGEKVSPLEVDAVLESHPAVACAAAFGVPHAQFGEDVVAAVELRAGHQIASNELRAFAASRLQPHKVPCRVLIVAEIPKNRVGKKQRHLLAHAHGAAPATRDRTPDFGVALNGLSSAERARRIEALIIEIGMDLTGAATWRANATFVELGLDSVGLTELRQRLEESLGQPISATSLFLHPTARALSTYLSDRRELPPGGEVARRRDRPLSYTELNWLNVAERTGSCVLVEGVRVRGKLSRSGLERALLALQARHPLLQVHVEGRRWSRAFVAQGTAKIPLFEKSLHSDAIEAELLRQINNTVFLPRAPLLELTWIQLEDAKDEHVLLVRASHAIWDGSNRFTHHLLTNLMWSLRGEECRLEPLPDLPSVDELVVRTPRRRFPVEDTLRLTRNLVTHRAPIVRSHRAPRTERITGNLDIAAVAALERCAREESVSLVSLASAALMRATRAQMGGEGQKRLSLMTFVDLRKHYDPPVESEQLGVHCTGLLHCHKVGRQAPLLELARAAKAALTRDLARGVAIDTFGLQRKLFRLSVRYPRLSGPDGRTSTLIVSHVGSFADMPARVGELEVLDVLCGESVHGAGPYACLFLVPFHDGLRLVLVYGAQLAETETMRDLMDAVLDDLRALACQAQSPS